MAALDQLKKQKTGSRKRLGRGMASGQGKTGGKGHKGQKARKGGGIAAGFEGGQTPLYRRVPKRGFTNLRNKVRFNIIHLSQLNCFKDGETVDKEKLDDRGLLRSKKRKIKIINSGKLDKKVTVKVDKLTGGARAAVEKVGGQVV